MNKKFYRVVTYYSQVDKVRQRLVNLGVTFVESNVLNGFWGTQFSIEKPKGKGAHEKMRQINKL